MTLENFIAETIAQIIKGTKQAQIVAKEQNAIVSPKPPVKSASTSSDTWKAINDMARMVEFDVALTVSQSAAKGATGGALISVIGIKADAASSAQNTTVSRVRFSIPVVLPVQQ